MGNYWTSPAPSPQIKTMDTSHGSGAAASTRVARVERTVMVVYKHAGPGSAPVARGGTSAFRATYSSTEIRSIFEQGGADLAIRRMRSPTFLVNNGSAPRRQASLFGCNGLLAHGAD